MLPTIKRRAAFVLGSSRTDSDPRLKNLKDLKDSGFARRTTVKSTYETWVGLCMTGTTYDCQFNPPKFESLPRSLQTQLWHFPSKLTKILLGTRAQLHTPKKH